MTFYGTLLELGGEGCRNLLVQTLIPSDFTRVRIESLCRERLNGINRLGMQGMHTEIFTTVGAVVKEKLPQSPTICNKQTI